MSTPDLNEIKEVDDEFWRWIFRENNGPNHPLKISNGGKAQTQFRGVLIVAGSVPGDGPKNRSLQIPSGIESIFVPADNCVYSEADSDGSGQELIEKANSDMARGSGNVSVNGKPQTVELQPGHLFSLNIQQCVDGTGKSKKGEGCKNGTPPPPEVSRGAAAASHYAIIRANALKSGDIISITGRKGEDIDVTYSVE